jgi:hypothetical protein
MPRDSITICDVLSLLSAWLPTSIRQNVPPVTRLVYSYSFVAGSNNDGGGSGAILRVAGRGGTIVAPPRLSFTVSHDVSKSPDSFLFGIADCSCGCGGGGSVRREGKDEAVMVVVKEVDQTLLLPKLTSLLPSTSTTLTTRQKPVNCQWCDHLTHLAADLAQRGERALIGAYNNSSELNVVSVPTLASTAAEGGVGGGGRRVAAFAARLKADKPVAASQPPQQQPVVLSTLILPTTTATTTTTLPLMPPPPVAFRASARPPTAVVLPSSVTAVKTKRARFTADMALDDEIEEVIEPDIKRIHEHKAKKKTNDDEDAEPIDE